VNESLDSTPFLTARRILEGPWQALERDVARLLIQTGFSDVRLVGGTGDRGADILAVKGKQTWIVQCKYVAQQYPPSSAVDEVVEAAKFYGAQRLLIAGSRPFGPGTHERVRRWARDGLNVELLSPSTLIALAQQAPEYPATRRNLRDYQLHAVDLLTGSLSETGRGQIVLATGLGKTVVMAETLANLYRDARVAEGRSLVLAHTRELVDQLQRSFWYQLPKWIPTNTLVGGEFPSGWQGITFGTIQSALSRLPELPAFGLILVDEAHHIGSDSFRAVVKELRPPMLGGATATPWRGDGYDIDEILGPPVIRIGIAEGLRRGFLCDVDYRILADNIDWELVRSRSKHRYSISQLNQRLLLPTRDEEAAKVITTAFRNEERRSLVVFCASVLHAESFAGVLRQFDLRAQPVSGDVHPREREKLMAKFRSGALDAICTCDLFNEGVDLPDVDSIAFMRVTHSRRIFVQQLGRGLRISPGKRNVMVLDFVSDLRRIAEVVQLQRAAYGDIERLTLADRLIQFRDAGAGRFMREWMLDQADLFMREGDAQLELPSFEYPDPTPRGNVQ
jgi:superfamily II DNA or RNA helicase